MFCGSEVAAPMDNTVEIPAEEAEDHKEIAVKAEELNMQEAEIQARL